MKRTVTNHPAPRMQADTPLRDGADTVEIAGGGQANDPPIINESNKGSYTKRDILHHHYFGRRGVQVTTRATKFSWEELPFVKPVTVVWKFPLSEHSILRLIYGYKPMEMPDKWFVYADGPDRAGKMVIKFIDSWTRKRVAELLVHSAERGEFESGLWTGEAIELTFEEDEDEAERIAEARLRDKDMSFSDPSSHQEAIGLSDIAAQESNETNEAKSNEPGPLTTKQSVIYSGERGELWVKFLVATVFKWVLHIDIDIDIPEPKRWTKLASEQAELVPITQTGYKGSSMSRETIELLQRLGPGTQITFD